MPVKTHHWACLLLSPQLEQLSHLPCCWVTWLENTLFDPPYTCLTLPCLFYTSPHASSGPLTALTGQPRAPQVCPSCMQHPSCSLHRSPRHAPHAAFPDTSPGEGTITIGKAASSRRQHAASSRKSHSLCTASSRESHYPARLCAIRCMSLCCLVHVVFWPNVLLGCHI